MKGVNSAKIGTGGRRFLLARHASTTTRYGELVSIAKKEKKKYKHPHNADCVASRRGRDTASP
jgi:hypothetical protein